MLLVERGSVIQWIGTACVDSNLILSSTGYVTPDELLNLSVLNGDKNSTSSYGLNNVFSTALTHSEHSIEVS